MEELMMSSSMMGGYSMIFGMGLMLLVWVGIFYLAFRLFKLIFANKAKAPQAVSALDTLKQRYAEGEINAEQFETMKKNLQPSEPS